MPDVDPPRLLLVSPPLDTADAAARTEAALAAAHELDAAALLLRPGGLADEAFAKALAPLLRRAQAADVAVLLEDRPNLVTQTGADGVHLNLAANGARLKDLRARFGADVILGAGCGASRHLAMTAGEAGADYVGFGELDGPAADWETVVWWEAVMTPPQVAFGALDPATACRLAAARPDFLAAAPALWATADEPAETLRVLRQALAKALADSG